MSDAILTIEAESLKSPAVRHAFFGRTGGVSDGIYGTLNAGRGSADDAEAVAENRRRIAAHLGVSPENLLSMHQIHSALALTVNAPYEGRPKADALVTKTPGLALGALHADCAPVLFLDQEAQVIGAAHSGWKGALGGILEATVEAMEAIGAERSRVRAAIGPTIGKASYEVGPEFPSPILKAHPEAEGFFAPSPRNGHFLFDLPGYIGFRLKAFGLDGVEDLGLDTYADEDRFFSYRRATHRREPDYGRLVSAIVLEGEVLEENALKESALEKEVLEDE